MVTLVDIKKAINMVLKNNFPDIKIYAEEIKEGFKRPAFFTQLLPVTSDYETVSFTSNKLMTVINYFSENETDLENIKIYDDLKKAFGIGLRVEDGFFVLQDIRTDTTDGVLQFKFDLNYLDKIEKTDEYETMEELKLRGDI